MQTIIQFDFPFPGPWGEAMSEALAELARDIAGEPGLLWKIWTENQHEGRAGGIYLFSDPESAARYRAKHEQRLAAFGIKDIRAQVFSANEALSRLTRGPLAG